MRAGGRPLHAADALAGSPAAGVSEPRIAIACSGLGHVQRGVEAWAEDMGQALRNHSVPSCLFGAGGASVDEAIPCFPRGSRAAGRAATLFAGLAAALLAILDPATRLRLAARARRHVEESFSDEAVIPRMLAMYRAVASGPHAAR